MTFKFSSNKNNKPSVAVPLDLPYNSKQYSVSASKYIFTKDDKI